MKWFWKVFLTHFLHIKLAEGGSVVVVGVGGWWVVVGGEWVGGGGEDWGGVGVLGVGVGVGGVGQHHTSVVIRLHTKWVILL